jgi:hypothetical protein
MKNSFLKVGDTVQWRGSFGKQKPKPAVVESIEMTTTPRSKHGAKVETIPWQTVLDNCAVIHLTNGHWAYGEQIQPAVLDRPTSQAYEEIIHAFNFFKETTPEITESRAKALRSRIRAIYAEDIPTSTFFDYLTHDKQFTDTDVGKLVRIVFGYY